VSEKTATELARQCQQLTDVICELMGRFTVERLGWAEERRQLKTRIAALEQAVLTQELTDKEEP
jgi:flagellar basal body-associated protein FliL